MVSQYGSEASIKIIVHFYQMYCQHRFQPYDYGEVKNMEVYGSKRPFLFPLKKIKLPVYMVYSDSDYFSYYKVKNLVYKSSILYGDFRMTNCFTTSFLKKSEFMENLP
jgi:hypothetical protein